MDNRGTSFSRWDVIWLAVCGVLSSIWCVTAATQVGATFDEPFYLRAGMDYWRHGTNAALMRAGTAPLALYVGTAPLHVWERCTGTTLDVNAADAQPSLMVARIAVLVFWWLLLIYTYLIAMQLAGRWAGRLAVAVLAAEPTCLAHASLFTTDIAVTACLLALWFHYRLGREGTWRWRVGLPALLYGIALSAKLSALAFGPIGLAMAELAARLRDAKPVNVRGALRVAWQAWTAGPFWRDLCQIGFLGLTFLFVFCGSDWQTSASFIAWADALPVETMLGQSMRWLSQNLHIFSNAGHAIAYQVKHNIRGHSVYVLGMAAPRAVWYYFPVAISIKTTLALLTLPALLLLLSPRSLGNWACGVAATLLLFSLNCRVQIGVRFMLPLLAIAVAGLSAAMVNAIAFAPRWRARVLTIAVVLCPLLAGWESANVWPNGLCYTNEVWGGTEKGYRLLCDSNYDWGQGIPELAAWAEERGLVDLIYFGTDPAADRPPFCKLVLPAMRLQSPGDLRAHCRGKYLAVGTTVLHGPFPLLLPQASTLQQTLSDLQPTARTATFFVYDINDLPATGDAGGFAGRAELLTSSKSKP